MSCHQFKLKCSQSPEHFNRLCFFCAAVGTGAGSALASLLSRHKMPTGSLRDGSFSREGEAELCSDLFCGSTRMIRGTSWPVHSRRVSNDLPLPFSGRITYQSRYLRNLSAFGGIFYGSHRFPASVILFLSLSGFEYCKSCQWTEDDITPKAQLWMYFSSSFYGLNILSQQEKLWWGCFLAKLPTSTWPFHTPFVRSNLTVLLR